MDFFNSLSLSNAYVLHTLYSFGVLALGLVGLFLGHRLASNGKLCVVLGIAVGVLTMILMATEYAVAAPGLCLVFLVTFFCSGPITKFAAGDIASRTAAPGDDSSAH